MKKERAYFWALALVFVLGAVAASANEPWLSGDLATPQRTAVHDYQVSFAGPLQTAYFVVDDRGSVRGPFESYEEAYEAGMQTPWVFFEVEERELPQHWIVWGRFEYWADAYMESIWLESIGFDTKIEKVLAIRRSK